MTRNQEIAQEILKVIGSMSRLSAMIGAKDFVAIDNGIQFGLKRAAKKVNKIVITVNGADLYDVQLGNFSKSKLEYKVINEFTNVYASELKSLLENETGLYFSL